MHNRGTPSRGARAAALLLVAAVTAGACEATPESSATPRTVSGAENTNLALTGARKGTIGSLARCDAAPLNALLSTTIDGQIYLFEIVVDGVGGAGSFDAKAGGKAVVTLSDSAGQAWHSDAEGGSGSVTVSDDLRAGSLEVHLANPADSSVVRVSGTWKCGG